MWFAGAAIAVAIALALPWWSISMVAPQYPDGLSVTSWFFRVTGDVREIDELNHYIGFMPLANVASVERSLALAAGPLTVLATVLATLVRPRWARIALALPAICLPVIFVDDLAAWLWYAGHHLDPHAALSSSVAPWTPHLLGAGGVGQFHTLSLFGAGFYVACAAAVMAIAGLRVSK